jgi:hypothetical protein
VLPTSGSQLGSASVSGLRSGGGSDRGHRSPEIVGVFSIVKCDHPVGETQIKQRKQPGVLSRRQVMHQRRGLSDLVPIVLNGPVPKPTGQCLVRGSGGAAGDPQCFDLVESIAVPLLINAGGPPGRNWLALSNAKGVTRDQWVN